MEVGKKPNNHFYKPHSAWRVTRSRDKVRRIRGRRHGSRFGDDLEVGRPAAPAGTVIRPG